MGGTCTPEYIAFRKNFSKLTEGILQAVPQVAAKAFDHSLITSENLSDAKNESKREYDRALGLLQILHNKIQSDEKVFGTIFNILSSMPELDHLKELLLQSKSAACSDLSSTAHDTIQVNIVQGYFYSLLVGIEKVLPQFASKSFEKELISEDNLRDATNSDQPEYDRSKAILETIKEKIESNPNCYDVFLSVLHEVPKLKDLVSVMEAIMKKERFISSSIPDRLYTRSRRLSNSDISNSDILKAQNLPEVLEPDSGIPCHDYDDMLTNCPEDDMSSLNVCEQHTSIFVDGLDGSTELPPSKIDLNGVTELSPSKIDLNELPVQTSLNEVTDPPVRVHSEMVVSNSAPTSHITDTEERFTRLKQEFDNCNKKLRQQGEHINNLMKEIGKLKDEKEKLKDVIAEKEKLTADLREETAETIKNLKESHRIEVQKLEHQLSQKEVEKEKELNQLRKSASEQEKIISDLKKEKKLELALKNVMLLSTQKELAEERESRAKDEAERAKDEAEHVKDKAKCEKEKRKSSETREKLAQEELQKMREKCEQLMLENTKQTS